MKRLIFGSLIMITLPVIGHAAANDTTSNTNTANTVQSSTNQPSANSSQTPPQAGQANGANKENVQTTQSAKPQAINCEYKPGDNVDTVPLTVIKQWAAKASEKAFTLSYQNVDSSMTDIQKCFTQNGWKSFSTALKRSGNIETIKKEKLQVSPDITGDVSVQEEKENRWKVLMPMTVTYRNDVNSIKQDLNVSILIGRKASGELGIMQLIAAPTKAGEAQAAQSSATTTASENKQEK